MPFSLPFRVREPVRLGRVGPLGLIPYDIPNAARHTHLYVIGTTGQGKSKFLESLLVQDILSGRGCGLVDPHSDLARDTLTHLVAAGFFNDPRSFERIIYFDPTRTDYLLPFNVLNSPLPAYSVAQQVIEAFRRTWPAELAAAPRFTDIMLHALLVLIENKGTLMEMRQLLTDAEYREQLLAGVSDPELVAFFHGQFDKWGREAPIWLNSVLNKVNAFAVNPYLRHMLGASDNRLDFRHIMDDGQVLIVDLGHCDGETRRLVGSLVVTGMEMAALSRKDQPNNRRGFYLYVDEFQTVTASEGGEKTLSQILSECRKFGLYLHLAHQTLGQLRGRISSALGNVGIKVVFAVDREDAEVMARKLFTVDTDEIKHDAQTDTQHPVYAPLPEQWERAVAAIQALTPRHAYVKQRGRHVALITTEPVAHYDTHPNTAQSVLAQLARTHGVAMPAPPVRSHTLAVTTPGAVLFDWDTVAIPRNHTPTVHTDLYTGS